MEKTYFSTNEEDLEIESILQILLGFYNNDRSQLIEALELFANDCLIDCEPVEDSILFRVLTGFDIVTYGVSVNLCWLSEQGLEVLKLLKDDKNT